MRVARSIAVAVAVLIAAACGSGGHTGGFSGSGAGASTGSQGSGGVGGSLFTGGTLSTGTNGSGMLDPDAACVTSSADGEAVPVDLYFMVDITGSMNCPVPEDPTQPACEVQPPMPFSKTTRWTVESTVLKSFMDSSANAGLGVGIGFFPDNSDICNANVYQTPAQPIAALPGAAMQLDSTISAQTPGGNTPTVPALQGALAYAKGYAMANPTHHVSVVYATDGYPQGCDSTNTIANAAATAQMAASGTPSIQTYVLGVGRAVNQLNQIAAAGGTTQAYLIDTTGNAADQLTAALASIRSNVLLGCTYTIPAPPAGQQIDYSKVNVTYTDPSGKTTDVGRDPSQTACNTGWQYSADKTQINLCGSLCDSVKANPGGKLTVLFGCTTQINTQ
jgi:hypothetical protein